MPVFKRKYESGKTVWRYLFSAPGSTRQDRRLIEEVGFASKQEAIDAEAKRRTEELQKYELAKAGAGPVAAALPTTLAMLFREFFRQHAEEKLAPKTIERYRELAAYLAPELLAMPLAEIYAASSEPRMEPAAQVRRPSPENETGSTAECQDRQAHCRSGLQRLRTGREVGAGR